MHRNRMYGTSDSHRVFSSHTATLGKPVRAGFRWCRGQSIPCHGCPCTPPSPWKGRFFIIITWVCSSINCQVRTAVVVQYQAPQVGSFFGTRTHTSNVPACSKCFHCFLSCFLSLHSIGRNLVQPWWPSGTSACSESRRTLLKPPQAQGILHDLSAPTHPFSPNTRKLNIRWI